MDLQATMASLARITVSLTPYLLPGVLCEWYKPVASYAACCLFGKVNCLRLN